MEEGNEKLHFVLSDTIFHYSRNFLFHCLSLPLSPTFKMAKAINLFNLSPSRHYLSALCSLPSIFISNSILIRPLYLSHSRRLLADVKLKIPAVIQD